jgi:hypothetical protein
MLSASIESHLQWQPGAGIRRPFSDMCLERHTIQVKQGLDQPQVSSNPDCNISLCFANNYKWFLTWSL